MSIVRIVNGGTKESGEAESQTDECALQTLDKEMQALRLKTCVSTNAYPL